MPPTFIGSEFAQITMDCSVGGVTVSENDGLVTVPDLAVILVVPTAAAVATPAIEMVAVALHEETQATPVVSCSVLLSLYVPVALN
jgi:hypothetical protein